MAPFSSPSHDSTNLNTLNSTMRIWIPLALAASSLAAPAMGYQHPGHDSVEATRQEIREIRAELRALRQEIKGQAQEARVHVLETARSGNVMHPQSNERVIIQRAQAGGTLWTPKAPTARIRRCPEWPRRSKSKATPCSLMRRATCTPLARQPPHRRVIAIAAAVAAVRTRARVPWRRALRK